MPRQTIKHQTEKAAISAVETAQRAAEGLNCDIERLERLATLGMLATGIVHELNNVLTPVLAYAQMAAANPDDPALQAKCIERTLHGAQLATRISEAVLGFSASNEHCETPADIHSAVEAALACVGRDPNKDRISIGVEIPAGLSAQIQSLSLQQILINLILNALTAMKGRKGRLTIAAIPRSDGMLDLRVSDTGCGIPAEIAGSIFEPFVTSKRSDRAGGLGLSICRRLAQGAGGSIRVISAAGEGTTFVVTLPQAPVRRAKAG